MNVDDMIEGLLGHKYSDLKSDPVPSYLAKKYDREGSAIALGRQNSSEPKILAALCRACFLDDEEDVRVTALESLYKLEPRLGFIIAHQLAYDREECVADTALDIMENYKFNNS